jgi:hypothetical protein
VQIQLITGTEELCSGEYHVMMIRINTINSKMEAAIALGEYSGELSIAPLVRFRWENNGNNHYSLKISNPDETILVDWEGIIKSL